MKKIPLLSCKIGKKRHFLFFLEEIKSRYPGSQIEIWYQDESRFGQKTRTARLWALKGSSPKYVQQNRFKSAYLFGSVHPESGRRVGLVASSCDSEFMSIHLKDVSHTAKQGVHIVLVVDGAGWHRSKQLIIPENISLCYLPPYSPELNPIERLWLYLKEKYLSFKTYASLEEILVAGQNAWQRLTGAEIKSVCRVRYSSNTSAMVL